MRRDGVSAIQGHSATPVELRVCGPFQSNYPASVYRRWKTKNGLPTNVSEKLIITWWCTTRLYSYSIRNLNNYRLLF